MTATAIKPLVDAYVLSSSPRLKLPLRDGKKLDRTCVRVEIKPHTPDGIRGGILQLWDRRDATPRDAACAVIRRAAKRDVRTVPLLITYQQHATNNRLFTIRALAGKILEDLVQKTDPRGKAQPGVSHPAWQILQRDLAVPGAVRMIPLWTCGTTLGNLMEGVIRKEYGPTMTAAYPGAPLILPWRNPSGSGSDILHEELRSFLAELQGELSGVR